MACLRDISPIMMGGFTQRVPYDCTQAFRVNRKPSRFSPKYSTMSLRSKLAVRQYVKADFLLQRDAPRNPFPEMPSRYLLRA